MKISIALCTYNGEKYLQEQLESFAMQTRLPDEIVVCDDRSDDATLEILRRFSQTVDFPVNVYVNDENLGSTKNFEKAIALCGGDIIVLSDQDDVWMTDKLEVYEREFTDKPHVGLVFSDGEIVDETLKPLGNRLSDYYLTKKKRKMIARKQIVSVLTWSDTVTGATVAFRSSLRNFMIPTPSGHGFIHDGWIAFLAALFTNISFIPQPLIKYRQHRGQQCGVPSGAAADSELIGLREQHQQTIGRCELRLKALLIVRDAFASNSAAGKKITELQNDDENLFKSREFFSNEIEAAINKLKELLKHTKLRRDMPKARMRKLKIIFGETLTGNYFRYSNGFGSAVKDFLKDSSSL